MDTHWIKTVQERARITIEEMREARKKYYDQQITPQPEIEISDFVMLKAKNMRTNPPKKKLTSQLYGHFEKLEKRGKRGFRLDIQPSWEIHTVFQVSLLEPYKDSDQRN